MMDHMSPPSFQTVQLSKGKHHSPESGACVMELASMLAHERFSDRPTSACPVLGGFLRTYNDFLDDRRRQSLYAYASRVVDTKSSPQVERARAARCLEWAREVRRPRSHPLRWLSFGLGPKPASPDRLGCEAAGVYAARAISRRDDEAHVLALAFVDELIAMDGREVPLADPAAELGTPAAHESVA